jgi:type II secretory pathway pseudopilin PulG
MKFLIQILQERKKKNMLTSVRAFTLVETLVSTMIISLVILGPLTVALNASTYARQTKDIMTATYLAQESIELLHHLQDSIYLKCITDTSVTNTVCQAQTNPGGIYEIPRETAWRVFKDYLTSGVSCFAQQGCSYDFIDMTADENAAPTKYLPTGGSCDTLSITNTYAYVCTGAHGSGGVATSFTRSVLIESLPTFLGNDSVYNDDLRITVTVRFRRQNGYTRTVDLVDFMHARS